MRTMSLTMLFVVAALAFCGAAAAVEEGDAALALQGGGLFYTGKMGKLFAPDGAYGLNLAYGFSNYFALDLDFLYSENQQTDKDKYGELSFNQGQAAIGVRAAYTTDYVMPYLTLAPMYTLTSYEALYDAGDKREQDTLNSHGFGGAATAGVDFFASDSVTMGLAGRACVVSTDMRFATGEDLDNRISVYTYYVALFRFTLVF